MTICSLQSVDGIPFGAKRSALSSMGSPLRCTRNKRGEEELAFKEGIYRFEAGKFIEISFPSPSVIELNSQRIETSSLVDFLKKNDSTFREVHGFAVAPTLGLAVDLEHDDHWITAFVAGRWDHIK